MPTTDQLEARILSELGNPWLRATDDPLYMSPSDSLSTTLLQERETGRRIAPVLALKGWERNKYNNTFHKDDKEAYFSGEWLIFHFSGVQYTGEHCNTFHRIKIVK